MVLRDETVYSSARRTWSLAQLPCRRPAGGVRDRRLRGARRPGKEAERPGLDGNRGPGGLASASRRTAHQDGGHLFDSCRRRGGGEEIEDPLDHRTSAREGQVRGKRDPGARASKALRGGGGFERPDLRGGHRAGLGVRDRSSGPQVQPSRRGPTPGHAPDPDRARNGC
jgi:hypothetical protein